MKRFFLPCWVLLVLLLGAATIQQHWVSPSYGLEEEEGSAAAPQENNQRLVFYLQYIASDYDRAVQNEQIVDSLEYQEMQRFAQTAFAIYNASTAPKERTLKKLSELARLIAGKASRPQVRDACKELVAACIKEKNLIVLPRVAPDLVRGEELFRENCVPCHGRRGAGDGPAADTLNPKPRDFTDSTRFRACAPHQLFQAITLGVEGTAMPAFAEAFTTDEGWDLAFYLMTLRCDFQPLAADTSRPFSLQQLATQNNLELAAILSRQKSSANQTSPTPGQVVDYFRQNPPSLTIEEYVAIAENLLHQSLSAYLQADSARAVQLADDAYWYGFEPIENKLMSRVYLEFEQTHSEYHWTLETPGQSKQARTLAQALIKILQQIRSGKGLRS
jgi:high-affinity iron transporter